MVETKREGRSEAEESPRAIDTEPRREIPLADDAAVQARDAPSNPGRRFPSRPPFSTPRVVQGPCDFGHGSHSLAIRRLGDTFMGPWNRKYLHCFIAPGRLLSADISIFFPTVHLTFEHRLSIEAARKNNVEIKG
jgi:hypothetical protein